jgi:hypothetical protein
VPDNSSAQPFPNQPRPYAQPASTDTTLKMPFANISSTGPSTIDDDEGLYPMSSTILPMAVNDKERHNVASDGPSDLTKQQREEFYKSLPSAVKIQLDQPFGKPSSSHSFTGDIEFRHVMLFVLRSGFLSRKDRSTFVRSHPLVKQLSILLQEHRNVDFRPIRGFDMYKDHETETTLNEDRTKFASAALLHYNMDMGTLVRYIGGPHVGAQRDVARIMSNIKHSVKPTTQKDLYRVYTQGAPTICNGHSTASNFLDFYKHGNHKSTQDHPDEFLKVFLKDCKRGHALALDIRLLPFIYHAHLTPQGIINIENAWKSMRLVCDSSFRPNVHSMAINDWTDTANEPELEFPGCLYKLLVWIWNLRISYPTLKILLGDNDITAAFRLIKYHPELVAMHLYSVNDKYLGAATGQTFGDTASPANFEVLAIARKEHAQWLFCHKPEECLTRAEEYVSQMKVPPEATPEEAATFSQANADSFNHGVFDEEGKRLPPPFPHQIDDCLFADVREHILLASAASIVALEDVSGDKHPCQPHVLSQEKLELAYDDNRVTLGHFTETTAMMVELSKARRTKIIAYIAEEGWLSRSDASLRETATLHGILVNAAEYCPWAKCQFFIIQQLLRTAIQERYHAVVNFRKRRNLPTTASADNLPKELRRRTKQLISRDIASLIWHNRVRIPIAKRVHIILRMLREYLQADGRWEMRIGHIVKRDPAIWPANDASEQGIGVVFHDLQIFCLVPLSDEICRRIKLPPKHPDYLQINVFEFLGIVFAYIISTLIVQSNPGAFPPSPIMHDWCDNTTAIGWVFKMSTSSLVGQSVLRLFAELRLISPVGIECTHLAGDDNHDPDLVSRPSELYSPMLPLPSARSFNEHIFQITQKLPKLASYRVFLPSPELLSSVRSSLSSDVNWAERPVLPKTLGQFATAESIFCGSFENSNSSTQFFL